MLPDALLACFLTLLRESGPPLLNGENDAFDSLPVA